MSLTIRKSGGGFLSPTSTLRHPIINLLMRIIVPLMPLAIEYFEDYIRRERARQKFETEAARPMSKPLSIDEAMNVLAIDPKHVSGANQIPFPPNSEARKLAEKNFKKFFAMCQPQIAERNKDFFFPAVADVSAAEGKSTEKKNFGGNNSIPPIPRNDYLAGKFSGSYRLLVDSDWDRNLNLMMMDQQQQQNNHNNENGNNNQQT